MDEDRPFCFLGLLPLYVSLFTLTQELEQKAERCVVQLSNAEKLIGGLGGEEKRWTDTVATLTLAMDKLPGKCIPRWSMSKTTNTSISYCHRSSEKLSKNEPKTNLFLQGMNICRETDHETKTKHPSTSPPRRQHCVTRLT